MKTIATLFAILLAASAPALAGPCVALDYPEMKDMSADDLVKEACKAQMVSEANYKQVLANLNAVRVAKPFPNAETDRAQCDSQIDRMLRILQSKGVTEKLYPLCARQAQGQIITAPAEAK